LKKNKIAIIGGGAAGFFAAIRLAELKPDVQIVIFEQANKVLQKVKISGGGRCNVTHACFVPDDLVMNYPRGEKELLGPFYKFNPADTMEWFENEGVTLKIEDDNRVFPISDSSQTIVDCLLNKAKKLNVDIRKSEGIKSFNFVNSQWELNTSQSNYTFDTLVMACGSNQQIWQQLKKLGHTIVDPVPSLFTFNISSQLIKDLPGVAVPHAFIAIEGEKLESEGPLLITHWGLSGPGILRLSAWGARILAHKKYNFTLKVNWLGIEQSDAQEKMNLALATHAEKTVNSPLFYDIPKRLWQQMMAHLNVNPATKWKQVATKDLDALLILLTDCAFEVNGKSTFKDEFVTAGGVELKEIDFRTMQSKCLPNLYFAGEVIDVDAITGGFNFQNAWTTAWLAANAIAEIK